MSAIEATPFPKPALIATAAMLGVTLAGTAAVRIARLNAPPAPASAQPAPLAVAQLRFADAPDGSIRVFNDRTGVQVAAVAPGSGGFVRGVLRGMARDRISRRIGAAPPFRLAQERSGHLTLTDTATGRAIDLEAFGADNRAAFLALMQAPGAQAGAQA